MPQDKQEPMGSLATFLIGVVGITVLGLAIWAFLNGIPEEKSVNGSSSASEAGRPNATSGSSNAPTGEDIRHWKIGSYVINGYEISEGLGTTTRSDLDSIAVEICASLESGGVGHQYYPDQVDETDDVNLQLATALNYAYATNTECSFTNDDPADNFFREMFFKLATIGDTDTANWIMSELGSSTSEYGNNHVRNLYQQTVPCEDDSLSTAGGRQGACSWHGGVAE